MAGGERSHLPLRHLPEALLKQTKARFIEGAHRLGQIPAMQPVLHHSLSSCHVTAACVCKFVCVAVPQLIDNLQYLEQVTMAALWGCIPVCLGHAQVKLFAGVVSQDPGEHRPLSQVIEGAPCRQVAEEQVVQIAQLALLPSCCHPLQPLPIRLQKPFSLMQAQCQPGQCTGCREFCNEA